LLQSAVELTTEVGFVAHYFLQRHLRWKRQDCPDIFVRLETLSPPFRPLDLCVQYIDGVLLCFLKSNATVWLSILHINFGVFSPIAIDEFSVDWQMPFHRRTVEFEESNDVCIDVETPLLNKSS
jgi:hypothetical protein